MAFQKGHPKPINAFSFPKGNQFAKNNSSNKTSFKKGIIPWNRGKKYPQFSGKNNPKWKGDLASLTAIHQWVFRQKGKPKTCRDCGKIGKKIGRQWSLDWANKDHTYKRNPNDYFPLCPSCHKIYDLKNNQSSIV